ncbi:hypothetical protein SLEP1_g9675 [Rubroshorea leprosula]|uniref:Uncharacterized protein n=2 Tax=Rubroshorea leprosula TaxID=152421 RepID=A0AAV5IDK9_9ROSI|nr:hypothetical protein SLEP1_g9675 [Rubroshorea leprosula]
MQSGNVVLSDTMQLPTVAGSGGGGFSGGGSGSGEIHPLQPCQWFFDERDIFISWLRGEFAAANAIIDSVCSHLRTIGEPGEYDAVLACIQQRRSNWSPVLHLQQYYSVAEVTHALHQAGFKRQQTQRHFDQVKGGGKELRRTGMGFKKGQRFEVAKEIQNSGVEGGENSSGVLVSELKSAEGEKDATSKPSCLKKVGSLKGSLSGNEAVSEVVNDGYPSSCKEDNIHAIPNENEKWNLAMVPKTFTAMEPHDGRMVNVVDGLRLYEELFDENEVPKFVSLVNDLRAAGKKGHLQGQTYIASKRPTKGHGREMIQFGLPMSDAPLDDDSTTGISKDRSVEPIPSLLQDAINRLVAMQVMSVKPDCCIIDIYNEGDHSQPHMWPHWFGKPICMLFLTECDITFGKVLIAFNPGDYTGALRLSFAPGSLLVMEGTCTDFAKHALPSVRKQRMLITFTKHQSKKTIPNDRQRLPSPAASQWGSSKRSPNNVRHTGGPKHHLPIPATGVLPAPIRPQIPPNGVQPLFVPTPVAPAMSFPTPVPIPPGSTGWASRFPVPGTGVFLPPSGSANSSSSEQTSTAATETSFTVETSAPTEKVKGSGRKSSHSTPKGKLDGNTQKLDSNESVDETL